MTTQEWISSDEEMWEYDFTDDFIWLPETVLDGVGRWVARKDMYGFTALTNAYRFVAVEDVNRFIAYKELR